MSARYVLVSKFARDRGVAEDALQEKITEGAWVHGDQYLRTEDGDILVITSNITKRDLRKTPTRRIDAAPPEPIARTARCGVYLLVSAGAVVYVGRSTSLRDRLRTHRASGRQFDEARVIACDEVTSVWLEKELIRTLNPAQNLLRYQRHARTAERALRREGIH